MTRVCGRRNVARHGVFSLRRSAPTERLPELADKPFGAERELHALDRSAVVAIGGNAPIVEGQQGTNDE
jgi:hypothetical protein